MKLIKLLPLLLVFVATSCVSVRVSTDYDNKKDFNQYKTFAFYKKGIDKVDISDLDKRRILQAIEKDLLAKGLTKSNDPDLLVNIFTKSRENVDIYNNWYGAWGWGPWYYGWYGPFGYGMRGTNSVSVSTEGTLFIDLIDAKEKELVWQGMGTGNLSSGRDITKKEARIKEFVNEILAKYPPVAVQ